MTDDEKIDILYEAIQGSVPKTDIDEIRPHKPIVKVFTEDMFGETMEDPEKPAKEQPAAIDQDLYSDDLAKYSLRELQDKEAMLADLLAEMSDTEVVRQEYAKKKGKTYGQVEYEPLKDFGKQANHIEEGDSGVVTQLPLRKQAGVYRHQRGFCDILGRTFI